MTALDSFGKPAPRWCRHGHQGRYRLINARGRQVFRCGQCLISRGRRYRIEKPPPERKRVLVANVKAHVDTALRLDPYLTYSEICARAGWLRPSGAPDTDRLRRCLGEKLTDKGNFREEINAPTALAIARAIHVDPWEIGL